MAAKINMISCDLDGTLLNNHKIISEKSVNALIDYQKKGYLVTLASGRYYKEIEKFAKQLQLSQYHGYVVCGNGYEIIDTSTNKIRHFGVIPSNLAHECIDLAKRHHLMQYISIHHTYHLSTNHIEKIFMKGVQKSFHYLSKKGVRQISYAAHLLDESVFAKDLKPFIQEGVVKIALVGTPINQKKYIQDLNQKYPDYFAFYPVNPFSIEITHHSVSKKNAVETIAKENGFTLNEVIAFGDSGNDEPLLQAAGIGITMKNGTKKALAKARTISEFTNHEDGVIKELEKYLKD